MEEEKKELEVEEVKAEEVKEEPKQEEQSGGMQPNSKFALISFILCVVGFSFAWGWIATSWIGIGLGIASLIVLKKNDPATEQQPFKTFAKIAKPVAIADIIIGAIMFVVALTVTIVGAILAAAEAAAAAQSAIALF